MTTCIPLPCVVLARSSALPSASSFCLLPPSSDSFPLLSRKQRTKGQATGSLPCCCDAHRGLSRISPWPVTQASEPLSRRPLPEEAQRRADQIAAHSSESQQSAAAPRSPCSCAAPFVLPRTNPFLFHHIPVVVPLLVSLRRLSSLHFVTRLAAQNERFFAWLTRIDLETSAHSQPP